MGYNPSAPNSIGVEWVPTVESVVPLTTTTTSLSWLVDSTATETISTIYVPHTWTGPSSGYGKLVVDVYDLADAGAGQALTTTRYAPNQDTAINNVFGPSPSSWGSTLTLGNGYSRIDDGSSPTDSDYVTFTNTSYLRMAFNTTGFTGQVSSVSFDVRAFGYVGMAGKLKVEIYNGTTWVANLGTVAPPANGDDTPRGFQTYRLGPFTTNPLTGLAWTASDIASFDTGTNLLVQLTDQYNAVAVSWLSMIVDHGVDKRVATGSTATQTAPPSGTQTNLPVTLASSWSKTSGTDYLLVARRIDDPAGIAQSLIPQPIYLGTATCPHGQGISYSATIESSGLLATSGSADTTKTVPFWLGTSGGAISADSQPYWDLTLKACSTGSTLEQGVNAASVQAYKPARVLLAHTATAPSADLLVKVRKVSDSSQVGGTGTITVADFTATTAAGTITDSTWGTLTVRNVAVDLATAATLATSTNYYLEFTSSAADAAPWLIGMLDATASHSLTGNQTYGGSTNQADVAGVAVPAGDLITRIAAAPAAPSSITVTKTTDTINGVDIDYADIDWVNGGALGAAFLRWEIERSEDAGTTWGQIATISTEATITFADYQSLRDTAVKYRVRAVRSDEAASDWTTQSGTITPASSDAWAVFTSNADPTVTVAYTPHGSTASWEFVDAEDVVFLKLHDADYQASFEPLEDRGIRWPFTLQIHTSQSVPSGGGGVRVFDVIRAAARSAGAVCLHTSQGERFIGKLVVGSGQYDVGSGAYFADCVFTQTDGTASVVAL